jgi:hypothetical protein
MAEPAAVVRPVLTLPMPEAEALAQAYRAAGTILEYASGGSTVLAGERPQGTIFSVESDAAWLAGLQAWFDAHPPFSRVVLHHADIGPTRTWGFPKGRGSVDLWPGYAMTVWERDDFLPPDLVLVDGRFRLACMLTTLYAIDRPTVLLVDDYAERPAYHRIETLAGRPEMIGRMARFALTPMNDLPVDLDWIAESFADPS